MLIAMNATDSMTLAEHEGVRGEALPGALEPVAGGEHFVAFAAGGDGFVGARFFVVDVELDFDDGASVQIGFAPHETMSPSMPTRFGLLPRVPTRLTFPLSALDGQTVFLPRTPLRLKATAQGKRTELSEVGRVMLKIVDPRPGVRLKLLSPPRLMREEPAYPKVDRVIVDELGQWAERDWPGKTKDVATLISDLRAARARAREPVVANGRSAFGGSLEHRFDASGFFRTHHDGRRWWLVDPEGCAFFSAGLDCVGNDDGAAVLPGTEHHFAQLPEIRERNGRRSVSFMQTNLRRAFGEDWFAGWREITVAMLRGAGFNTVANWSNLEFARSSGLPYVVPMPEIHASVPLIFRSLPDVFDPAYERACEQWAAWLEPYSNDRNLIGYFMTNEPVWAFGKHNLASEMLEANPGTHTRRAFAAFLRERYRDDADAFAKAWGAEGKSFESIERENWRRAEQRSEKALEDTWDFSKRIVRRWMSCMTKACRTAAPNHLNLGVRWAWISSDLCYEVADDCDVFAINNYGFEPPLEHFAEIGARTNKPVMIGEFHHGATDRGLPSTGIQGVATTRERGIAYQRYVELCASSPACVGCHYFQYADQPIMGRFDGENYNIGFVDVCFKPYAELLDAAKAAHARVYAIAAGETPPTEEKATRLPPIFF